MASRWNPTPAQRELFQKWRRETIGFLVSSRKGIQPHKIPSWLEESAGKMIPVGEMGFPDRDIGRFLYEIQNDIELRRCVDQKFNESKLYIFVRESAVPETMKHIRSMVLGQATGKGDKPLRHHGVSARFEELLRIRIMSTPTPSAAAPGRGRGRGRGFRGGYRGRGASAGGPPRPRYTTAPRFQPQAGAMSPRMPAQAATWRPTFVPAPLPAETPTPAVGTYNNNQRLDLVRDVVGRVSSSVSTGGRRPPALPSDFVDDEDGWGEPSRKPSLLSKPKTTVNNVVKSRWVPGILESDEEDDSDDYDYYSAPLQSTSAKKENAPPPAVKTAPPVVKPVPSAVTIAPRVPPPAVSAPRTRTPPPAVTVPRVPPPDLPAPGVPPPAVTIASRVPPPAVTVAPRTPPPDLSAPGVPPPAVTIASRVPPPAVTIASRVPTPAVTIASRVPPPAVTIASRVPPPAVTIASRVPPPAVTIAPRTPPPAVTIAPRTPPPDLPAPRIPPPAVTIAPKVPPPSVPTTPSAVAVKTNELAKLAAYVSAPEFIPRSLPNSTPSTPATAQPVRQPLNEVDTNVMSRQPLTTSQMAPAQATSVGSRVAENMDSTAPVRTLADLRPKSKPSQNRNGMNLTYDLDREFNIKVDDWNVNDVEPRLKFKQVVSFPSYLMGGDISFKEYLKQSGQLEKFRKAIK